MAVIYLRSADGSDASDGLTWANAKLTLQAALTAAGAGGTVYVADGHVESTAGATTLASPGTVSAPVHILCVDDTGDPEPPTALATTATYTRTGAASSLTFTGAAYYYGIQFEAGNGATNASHITLTGQSLLKAFESCILKLGSSSTGSRIVLGDTASAALQVELQNTQLFFTSTSTGIDAGRCKINIRSSSTLLAATSAVPTTLILSTNFSEFVIRGCDLSDFGAGKTLFVMSGTDNSHYTVEGCKLGASVTLSSGAIAGQGGVQLTVVNCDSADTNYNYYRQTYQGEIFDEATIVRTGGASDGTTPISRRMVSSANSDFYSPLISQPIAYWNETTGSSVTVTVEVITDNVTLTDAECWAEVEYLGTSGFPLSLFANDRATSALSTPANQTSSSETWTTTGLTTPIKQALAVSFTPQEKGPVYIRVHLAKASTTVYVCPKCDVT